MYVVCIHSLKFENKITKAKEKSPDIYHHGYQQNSRVIPDPGVFTNTDSVITLIVDKEGVKTIYIQTPYLFKYKVLKNHNPVLDALKSISKTTFKKRKRKITTRF